MAEPRTHPDPGACGRGFWPTAPSTLGQNVAGARHLTKSAAATSTWQTRSATKDVNIMTHLLVRAIDPAHLEDVRITGVDGHGNRLRPFAATGQGEPLRCCLRYACAGEQITLISYAPFDLPSVWREVGPVYIHAARCDGYVPTGRLPEQLATGPRVLRTYRADDTMNYDHNTVILDEADLEPTIESLLAEADIATVHVRTVAPQCFLYAVAAI
jgi:Protein of unknown function (DUF1203)